MKISRALCAFCQAFLVVRMFQASSVLIFSVLNMCAAIGGDAELELHALTTLHFGGVS